MKKTSCLLTIAFVFLLNSCDSGKENQSESTDSEISSEPVEEPVSGNNTEAEEVTEGLIETFDEFKEDLRSAEAETKTSTENTYKDEKGRTVYTMVSEMPTYPGGEREMFRYLRRNIKYPREARNDKVEGTPIVQFVIGKNGEIESASIAKSSGNDFLDEEAVRVISSMPAWTPGKQNGESVLVKHNIPIRFQLQ